MLQTSLCVTPEIVSEVRTTVAVREIRNVFRTLDRANIRDTNIRDRLGPTIEKVMHRWVDVSQTSPIQCISGDTQTHREALNLAGELPIDIFDKSNATIFAGDARWSLPSQSPVVRR